MLSACRWLTLGALQGVAACPTTSSPNERLDMSEPSYPPDDGPLTDEDWERLRAAATAAMPRGRQIWKRSLIEESQCAEDLDAAAGGADTAISPPSPIAANSNVEAVQSIPVRTVGRRIPSPKWNAGNVWAELGFPDEAAWLSRVPLVMVITGLVRCRGWSLEEAATKLGLPDLPRHLREHGRDLSEATLHEIIAVLQRGLE